MFFQDRKRDKQEALEAEWRDSKVFAINSEFPHSYDPAHKTELPNVE